MPNHAHRRPPPDGPAFEQPVGFWRLLRHRVAWFLGAGTGRAIPAAWALRSYERPIRDSRPTRAGRYRV